MCHAEVCIYVVCSGSWSCTCRLLALHRSAYVYVLIHCEILGFTHPNQLQIWFIQSVLSSCIRKLKTVVIIIDDRFLSKPQLRVRRLRLQLIKSEEQLT